MRKLFLWQFPLCRFLDKTLGVIGITMESFLKIRHTELTLNCMNKLFMETEITALLCALCGHQNTANCFNETTQHYILISGKNSVYPFSSTHTILRILRQRIIHHSFD